MNTNRLCFQAAGGNPSGRWKIWPVGRDGPAAPERRQDRVKN